MNRTTITSMIGGVLLAVTVFPLSAQAPGEERERGRFWERISGKYDSNGDGVVSREEFDDQSDPFARLDHDGDGVLTAADFPRDRPRRGGFFVRQADGDEDGAVSAAEWGAFLTNLDADSDGLISDEELAAILPERGPASHGGALQRITAALDRDDDGQLESADFDAFFAALDGDGNGSLSSDEVPRMRRPMHRRGHRGPGARALHATRLLIAADRAGDSDEAVSRGEWEDFLAFVDADGDGIITGEELQAARPADGETEPEPRPARQVEIEVDKLLTLFDHLDANGDQVVDRDELPSHRRRGPRPASRG